MRGSSFAEYFVSGVLWTNSMPHVVIAATGRRNVTPFGRSSSAAVNLLWGLLNAGGGYVFLRWADRSTGATQDETTWQLPFEAGCMFWSAFGVGYALFNERRTQRM